MVKNSEVFSAKGVFFLNTLPRVLRQSVDSSVCLALAVIDLEVVARKFLSPIDLSKAQTFCIYELTKVVVVCKDKNLVFATF